MKFVFKYPFRPKYFSCYLNIILGTPFSILFLFMAVMSILDFQLMQALEAILFGLPFFALSLKCIDILVWAKKGYEEITITGDLIVIEKKGKLLKYRREIKIRRLIKVTAEEDEQYGFGIPISQPRLLYILSEGTIRFYFHKRVGEREIKAGLRMPLQDAFELRDKIMLALKSVKVDNDIRLFLKKKYNKEGES